MYVSIHLCTRISICSICICTVYVYTYIYLSLSLSIHIYIYIYTYIYIYVSYAHIQHPRAGLVPPLSRAGRRVAAGRAPESYAQSPYDVLLSIRTPNENACFIVNHIVDFLVHVFFLFNDVMLFCLLFTPNLPTNIVDFTGFDSSIILI